MILSAGKIADLLEKPGGAGGPLTITPTPNTEQLRKSGAASVDLRLGTWFLRLQQTRITSIDVTEEGRELEEHKITKLEHIRFGSPFVLHPRSFALGVSLEWIRLPLNLAGYVVGRSSWGRRGLIIATAVGVHPGFTGCLTLELSNLGETPLQMKPGLPICQLFLEKVEKAPVSGDASAFVGYRRPVLGKIELDELTKKLAKAN